MPAKKIPDKGELVVCTVLKAKGFGAFVKLEEYPDTEGFIHIKEVASGWVKHIRNYVKEGQKIVCKVMEVDPTKGYIDLSLKRVNEHQRREKTQQWKNEHKAEKLFQMVADRIGKNVEECYEKFGNDLIKKYGSLYEAFDEVAYDNEVLKKDGFSGDWISAFEDVAKENIIIPFVDISGYVELFSPGKDGVKHIRNALKKIEKNYDNVSVTVKYASAPRYRVSVTAPDYKTAEKELKECAERGIEYIKKHGGMGTFKRKIK
ncbi:MAG: translation initiation factor IF-2 subunit alpha [Candidatus Thermoplasmatota archaeon]|nr:translation initiation factor IF-2 subunit alpha [Candidatus Thermoplasmatota archaeon]